jgi:hypothetical protein
MVLVKQTEKETILLLVVSGTLSDQCNSVFIIWPAKTHKSTIEGVARRGGVVLKVSKRPNDYT